MLAIKECPSIVPGTLAEMLTLRAAATPNRRAFAFVEDGTGVEDRMTFGELDRRARAIAAQLTALGAKGERVLLLYPTGLDYVAAFFGCLYAGAIGVPAYPPDPTRFHRSLPRLMGMVADCLPKLVLTVSRFLPLRTLIRVQSTTAGLSKHVPFAAQFLGPKVRRLAAVDIGPLTSIPWIPTEGVTASEGAEWEVPAHDAEDIAYLQYTSGSTSDPKGVMITHSEALANLDLARALIGVDSESTVVGWVPLYHDMGLVCHVLGTVLFGYECILLSPLDFLKRPAFWLESIARFRAVNSAGPNFAYDLCVQKTTPAERAALDLSSWRAAGNGAEPVRPDTLRRFAEAFAVSGFRESAFRPAFGLAETVLFATVVKPRDTGPRVLTLDAETLGRGEAKTLDSSDASRKRVELVSCGNSGPGHRAIAADPERRTPCPEGRVGEIWLSGPSIPRGYWKRPEISAETFHAHLEGDDGRWLRTGDLGFVLDGEIYVTGRIKDLIIVRGRNLYPQDIELSVQRVSSLLHPSSCAAFGIDEGGEEKLVLVQEVDGVPKHALAQLADAMRAAVLGDHEVSPSRILFVAPGALPRTASNKLQRRATRAEWQAGQLRILSEH